MEWVRDSGFAHRKTRGEVGRVNIRVGTWKKSGGVEEDSCDRRRTENF